MTDQHTPATSPSSATKRPTEFVTSFEKGLGVLQAFGVSQSRMTLTQVAEHCGQTRASARRFLLTLVELGFAKSDGKYFELTPKVLSLGFSYLSSLSIWDVAQPIMKRVTQELGESCSAAVLDQTSVVYVARSAGPQRVMSVGLQIGTRLPAHATSMGHVLLAFISEADRQKILPLINYQAFTESTILHKQALLDRLAQVRQSGYALVDSELETGLRSLAVPIFNRQGEIVAALNVSTQISNVSVRELTSTHLASLQGAAKEITATMV